MKNDEIYGYGENELSQVAFERYNVHMIYDMNVSNDSGKNEFDVIWSAGSLYSGNKELSIYHFYKKNETNLIKNGNIIFVIFFINLNLIFFWF